MNTKTAKKVHEGLLFGLPLDPTEEEIHAFVLEKVKKEPDLTEKQKLLDALASNTVLGKREINKIWKAAEATTKRVRTLDYYAINREDFDTLVAYAKMRLEKVNEQQPILFQRGGSMVRVVKNEDGSAQIEVLNQDGFAYELNCFTKWKHVNEKSGAERLVPACDKVVKHLYNAPKSHLPPLTRLTTVPTYCSNAKLLIEPGYQNGIYYAPQPGFSIDAVPSSPDEETVRQCVKTIVDLFADFSLDGLTREEIIQAVLAGDPIPSFAHLVSYILSFIVRELIAGPCPGHLARKDRPRSGASLIMTTAERIATGQPSAPQTLPIREEEIQKTVLSALMEGAGYILFDNIRGGAEVESDSLAAGMTAHPSYKGRLLGSSKIVSTPAKAIFGFTGNRSALSPQLAERMLLIEVDPRVENPGARPPNAFRYNLSSEIEKRGSRLLWCFLVLVQNWIAKGRPEWSGTPLGGFERHAAVVGGILDAAGIRGFMSNREKLADLVKVDDPVDEFMDALIAVHNDTPNTAFKAGNPTPHKDYNVVSFREVLDQTQIPLNGFGYQTRYDDGTVYYPPAADRKIAQKIKTLVGGVRELGEKSYRLVLVEGTKRNEAKLYRLAEASSLDAIQAAKRKQRRRSRAKF